jgi:hypothetical protein
MEICFLNTGLSVKLFKVIRIIRRMEIEWNKLSNLKFLIGNKNRLFEIVLKSFSFSESNNLCMTIQSLSEYTSLCWHMMNDP